MDAPNVGELVHFYSRLRGWPIRNESSTWATRDPGEGVAYLSIQFNPDYVRPVWPTVSGHQQMMIHLDFEVTDLESAVNYAISLGAELAEYQPQEKVRVMLDPAGHPFCMYV